MFTPDPKSAFWLAAEAHYEAKYGSGPVESRPGNNFWLTDDMKYVATEEIGEGAFATVWRAQEKVTGRVLAVKRFSSADLNKTRREVKDESQKLNFARFGPHILRAGSPRRNLSRMLMELPMELYDHDLSYLMMETRAERGLVRDTILIPWWYNAVLTQMLEALQFLHRENIMIVHRDVSPQNILYKESDPLNFVLGGFSLARTIQPDKGENNEKRTFRYLAPEVYDGLDESPATDIWALGILCLDSLRLVPKVYGAKCQHFASFKENQWCDAMCIIAKYTDRSEVNMMVIKSVADRSNASSLLAFVRNSPGYKILHFKPNVALLYFLFRQDLSFGHLTDEEVRDFAATYLQNPRRPPPPTKRESGSERSADPLDSSGRVGELADLLAGRAALRVMGVCSEQARAKSQTTANESSPRPQGEASILAGAVERKAGEETAGASGPRAPGPGAPGPGAPGPGAPGPGASGPGTKGPPLTSAPEGSSSHGSNVGKQPVSKPVPRTQASSKPPEPARNQASEVQGLPSPSSKKRSQQTEPKARSASPPSRQPEAPTRKSDFESDNSSVLPSRTVDASSQKSKMAKGKPSSVPSVPKPKEQNPRLASASAAEFQGSLKAKPKDPSPPSSLQPRVPHSGQIASEQVESGAISVPPPLEASVKRRDSPPPASVPAPSQPVQAKSKREQVSPSSASQSKGREPAPPSSGRMPAGPQQGKFKGKDGSSPSASLPRRRDSPPPNPELGKSQPVQGEPKGKEASSPSALQPKSREPAPPSSSRTPVEAEQAKPKGKKKSSLSTPQPKNQDSTAPSSGPAPVEPRQRKSKGAKASPASSTPQPKGQDSAPPSTLRPQTQAEQGTTEAERASDLAALVPQSRASSPRAPGKAETTTQPQPGGGPFRPENQSQREDVDEGEWIIPGRKGRKGRKGGRR